MDKWTTPYKRESHPNQFPVRPVIASGPGDAPPVVLLHALLAGAASRPIGTSKF
ncbi:hypothetical protein [Candidatus Villigracilis affinis]|uniref:hypothetical protein n=1 Tax=Candidatus Villigracilis affinis TaxID=3140682 RepID=UPI001DB46811|nr:hypothetical protein [Anaerolineales bacterium]